MPKKKKIKITVLKRQDPKKIFDEYPVTERDWFVPCKDYKDGQEFMLESLIMPEDFCPSAWEAIYSNLKTIWFGGNLPYFKEKGVAVGCCPDGMRPVIFKIERL
jgi:uncharacterized repeat protein (TIGR04076 family)